MNRRFAAEEEWLIYTILVLEDDLELNHTICTALQKENYRVYNAHTCKDGQFLASGHTLDMVILDINLPDGDGFQFCRWIKSRSNLSVLFLSARDLEEDVLNGKYLFRHTYGIPYSEKTD